MRGAFVGKGGSGKTTVASLVMRVLSQKGFPVLAIDADVNQHLLHALSEGADDNITLPSLGIEIDRLKEYFRGTNPLIRSEREMQKTTPPGKGSRLMTVSENNKVYEYFSREVGGIRMLATGEFTKDDLGVKCYHSKTGAVELLLNHLVDRAKEYVLVDMTAGADAFASGLFTRFDATFIIVEPTRKSLSVFDQYVRHASEYGVRIFAIGNKVADSVDREFLRQHLGEYLIGTLSYSDYVRSAERGYFRPISVLEPENMDTINMIIKTLDETKKDWGKYHKETIEFHKKNALAWGNMSVGADLCRQIDPEFAYPTE